MREVISLNGKPLREVNKSVGLYYLHITSLETTLIRVCT